MKNRSAYLETTALALMAFILIGTAIFSLHLDLLNTIHPSDLWAERSVVLRCLIGIYGAAIAIAAAVSFIMIRYQGRMLSGQCFRWARSVAQEVNASWNWFFASAQTKHAASWLILLTAVGAAVRCYFLAQPMRYDEAYTFLKFVNRGFFNLFFYPIPNNHVLHTLLVRMSVGILGSHPVAIRLPAFLAGLLVIPLTFYLSRLLTRSSKSGFLAAGLVSAFPYLILYDTMARGYSLMVLLSLCLAGLGVRLVEHPSTRLCALISLLIALGLWNIPSFLFPAAGILFYVLVMLAIRGHKPLWILSRVLMPCLLMTMGLTGLFYTPVIFVSNGIGTLVANKFVKSLPWQKFLTRLPVYTLNSANTLTRDVSTLVIFGVLLFFVIGSYSFIRKGQWGAFMLLPALVIGGAAVLFFKHTIPFPRTWIYLLPFIFIVVDAGFVALAKFPDIYVKSVLLLLTGFSAVLIINQNIVSSYLDTGHFPEAPVLVDALSAEMNPGDKIVVQCPADAPVHFYMWYMNVPRQKDRSEVTAAPRKFYIVKPRRYSLKDLTKQNARRLLKIGGAELYVSE